MATQIASTPVVKGEIAVKVYKEANQKRSEASQRGAQKLATKFSKKVKRTSKYYIREIEHK